MLLRESTSIKVENLSYKLISIIDLNYYKTEGLTPAWERQKWSTSIHKY